MRSETDRNLAAQYGAYASFPTPADPIRTETHGDAPSEEMDRLLWRFSGPESRVLDLGCGAGQTLCALAPSVDEIWGIDLEGPLLAGARERAVLLGITNATFVHGDTTNPVTVAALPDDRFHLVYSRRGPFLTASLLAKLTPDAHCIVELYQDPLGLKEIFGRRPFLTSQTFAAGDGCVQHHAGLDLLPVSVKYYYYDQYFRDADHLAAYLQLGAALSNWWMPPRPYDPASDRPALELYGRYHATEKGIRVTQHRRIYLFHRAPTSYYPVDGAR